jgi:hypothetical protein
MRRRSAKGQSGVPKTGWHCMSMDDLLFFLVRIHRRPHVSFMSVGARKRYVPIHNT